MSFTQLIKVLGLAALLAGAMAAPALAATAATTDAVTARETAQAPAQPAKAKTKKKKSNTVKYDKGSAETTAERDRRLKRECKGRPNAGACLGYAS
jgi:hypothetical protein